MKIGSIIENNDKKYRILSVLGSGSFSTVFLTENTETSQKLALKVMNRFSVENDIIKKEINIQLLMKKLCSPNPEICKNIIYIIDYFEDHNNMFITFPYIENSIELLDFINNMLISEDPKYFEKIFKVNINVIIQCLKPLQELNIVHLDIKNSNILIKESDLSTYLIDFGLSCYNGKSDNGDDIPCKDRDGGTLKYCPPEILIKKQPITYKADIFSFACMLFEMIVGDSPHGLFVTKMYGVDERYNQYNYMVRLTQLKDNERGYNDVCEYIRRVKLVKYNDDFLKLSKSEDLINLIARGIEYDHSKRPEYDEFINVLNELYKESIEKKD